jgi:hypothetical protein
MKYKKFQKISGCPYLYPRGTVYGNSALQNIENYSMRVELKFNMILSRKDFNWSMTVNASTIENKLLNYPQEEIINGKVKSG